MTPTFVALELTGPSSRTLPNGSVVSSGPETVPLAGTTPSITYGFCANARWGVDASTTSAATTHGTSVFGSLLIYIAPSAGSVQQIPLVKNGPMVPVGS